MFFHFRTDILKSQLSLKSLKIYNAQNTNGTSKEVTEFNEVTKVDDHWLTISLENGETAYVYIEDVVDVFKV